MRVLCHGDAGSNAVAVSEAALLLVPSVLRRLPTFHRATAEGPGWRVPVTVGEQCGEPADGRLGGAGLDVFADEPHRGVVDHPISGRPQVVVPPHVAWLTWETLERSLDLAVAAAVAVRDGAAPAGRVV